MTREEAMDITSDLINGNNQEEYPENYSPYTLINQIFDDFKSRTCDNCKHWRGNIETPSKGICEQLGVHNIGGCGDYFERKEK